MKSEQETVVFNFKEGQKTVSMNQFKKDMKYGRMVARTLGITLGMFIGAILGLIIANW